jgi:hypothetical protein
MHIACEQPFALWFGYMGNPQECKILKYIFNQSFWFGSILHSMMEPFDMVKQFECKMNLFMIYFKNFNSS